MNGYDEALRESAEDRGDPKSNCTKCRQIFSMSALEFCEEPSCMNLLCRGCRQDLGGCCKEEHLPEIE